MNCREKHRLLAEYDAAALRLSHAEGDLAKRVADEASRSCGETMAALQTHLLLHGCGHAQGSHGPARNARITSARWSV